MSAHRGGNVESEQKMGLHLQTRRIVVCTTTWIRSGVCEIGGSENENEPRIKTTSNGDPKGRPSCEPRRRAKMESYAALDTPRASTTHARCPRRLHCEPPGAGARAETTP